VLRCRDQNVGKPLYANESNDWLVASPILDDLSKNARITFETVANCRA
jgi:hypothetical protein